MTFEEKLVNQEYDRIWQEYCGFLDLDMDSYMTVSYTHLTLPTKA